MSAPRIVVHFSCGAASAVAAKLAIAEYGAERVAIYNAFVAEEHPDNRRFLKDCAKWFGQPIYTLTNHKYDGSAYRVWLKNRYIAGRFGAPCSRALKREVLDSIYQAGDIDVIGYTVEERERADRWLDANPHRMAKWILIERELGKADCLAMVDRAGIQLPAMYRLGYKNANCIGCPKGGAGYWNKIRIDFPEQFEAMADLQDALGPGAKFLRDRRTGQRVSLRELDPTHGNMSEEPAVECGLFCLAAEGATAERADRQ